MRVIRFLLAAIIVMAALFAGFFALAVVAVIGLVALVVHSIRRRSVTPASMPGSPQRPPVHRERPAVSGEEVIDIEATRVTDLDRP